MSYLVTQSWNLSTFELVTCHEWACCYTKLKTSELTCKTLVYIPMYLVFVTSRFFHMCSIFSIETTLSPPLCISWHKTENKCLVSILFILFSKDTGSDNFCVGYFQFLSLVDFILMLPPQVNKHKALPQHPAQRRKWQWCKRCKTNVITTLKQIQQ